MNARKPVSYFSIINVVRWPDTNADRWTGAPIPTRSADDDCDSGAVLEESVGGNAKKVDDLFLVVALKLQAEILNESLRPSKNAPFITVCRFSTAYCSRNENIWGTKLRLGGGAISPCPKVKPRLLRLTGSCELGVGR